MRYKTVIVSGEGLQIHVNPKVASASISRANKRNPQYSIFSDDPTDNFRFMVVRHPLSRIVSFYKFFVLDAKRIYSNQIHELGYEYNQPFEEFLEQYFKVYNRNHHSVKQSDLAGPFPIDCLVKLENLNKEWPKMMKRFEGLNGLPEEKIHKTDDSKPWQDYFTTEQRYKAEQIFKEDLWLYERAI